MKVSGGSIEQFAATGLGPPRNHRRDFSMEDRVQIDRVHARAICNEIGERLRYALSNAEVELPASLESRLNRLREQDGDYSPSIVPSMDQQ
jgi:hypothetical protein